jgi:hypothetical protein
MSMLIFCANELFIFVFDIIEQRDLTSPSPVGINETEFVKYILIVLFLLRKQLRFLFLFCLKMPSYYCYSYLIELDSLKNFISAYVKYQKVFWTVKTLYAVTSMTGWLCTVRVIKIHPKYTKFESDHGERFT